MALKHDAQGFLIGDPIDLGKAVADWSAIRNDVRAIRLAVHGIESALSRATPDARIGAPVTPGRRAGGGVVGSVPRRPAQPLGRDSRGRFVRNSVAAQPAPAPADGGHDNQEQSALRSSADCVVDAAKELSAGLEDVGLTVKTLSDAAGEPMASAMRTPAVPQADSAVHLDADAAIQPATPNGRDTGAAPADSNRDRDGQNESALRSLADRIVGAVKASGSGLEEADPTVKAFNEVAQPMARGYELLTGGNRQKKQEGWLRRIYNSLTGFRKDEGLFNKIAAKRLKAIEEKPVAEAGGGGGLLGMLGGLLKRIPGVGALAAGAGAGGLLARGGKLLAGAGRMAAGAGRGLLGLGRGALRRLPVIGALLGGIGAATDIYDSETDDTLTRREKDQRAGKAAGGLAGSLGGMFAGAKLGAMVGAFAGPVGAAIGGAIGGAAGLFFGDQAGQILGETVGGWINELRAANIPGKISDAWCTATQFIENAWNEVKVTALGTWDWVKSGWNSAVGAFQKGWDVAISAFSTVGDSIKKAWGRFVDAANEGWKSVSDAFASAYEGLKSLPGIGPAIKAAEVGALKVAEAAGAMKDGAVDLGGRAVQIVKSGSHKIAETASAMTDRAVDLGGKTVGAVKSGAGSAWNTTKSAVSSAWSGSKDFAVSMVPQGLKNRIAARRAMETGADYKQGHIAGLDDAHTRALVASTAATESAGGKLDMVNSAGYMGRYQAGAGWLADAGLIKGGSAAVRAAMKADGFTNEYQWGQSGGMSKFLKIADNWNGGMDYDKYLSSADAQDAAFKTNSDKSYARLLARGVIKEGMSQDEIAGILKARHIAGEGGAAQAARGVSGPADANGTTALKYKNDLAIGNIYTKAFASVETTPGAPAAPTYPAAASVATSTTTTGSAPTVPVAPANPATVQTVTSPATPSYARVTATPALATVAVPPVPSVPTATPVAEAPQIAVPMASNNARQPTIVVAGGGDVGQDLRERGIAHIATGGLGGA